MSLTFLLSFFLTSSPVETNPTPVAETAARSCTQGSSNGDCWLTCYDDDGMMLNSSYCALNQDGSHTCTYCYVSGTQFPCNVWNTTNGCPWG